MEDNKIVLKGWLQSSADPKKISLTIESAGKSLAGVVALFAAVKGLDPQGATAMWEALVSQAVILVTAGFTAWSAVQTMVGLIRKALIFVGSAK